MPLQMMTRPIQKTFRSPSDILEFPHGRIEVVRLEDTTVTKVTLRPGWRWDMDMQSMAGTENCQLSHLQYVLSGKLKVRMEDGTELTLGPGDTAAIPPGHTAEVLGDESYVAIDFLPGMLEYLK